MVLKANKLRKMKNLKMLCFTLLFAFTAQTALSQIKIDPKVIKPRTEIPNKPELALDLSPWTNLSNDLKNKKCFQVSASMMKSFSAAGSTYLYPNGAINGYLELNGEEIKSSRLTFEKQYGTPAFRYGAIKLTNESGKVKAVFDRFELENVQLANPSPGIYVLTGYRKVTSGRYDYIFSFGSTSCLI